MTETIGPARRTYRLPADVAWVEVGSDPGVEAVAARIPDGPPMAMQGSSAVIWLATLELSQEALVITRVAEITGEERETVGNAVLAFLTELVTHGLLERGQPVDPPSESSESR